MEGNEERNTQRHLSEWRLESIGRGIELIPGQARADRKLRGKWLPSCRRRREKKQQPSVEGFFSSQLYTTSIERRGGEKDSERSTCLRYTSKIMAASTPWRRPREMPAK
ncbi:hypothetical protein MTO96_007069 [Rhipicephalus appendiculatus]